MTKMQRIAVPFAAGAAVLLSACASMEYGYSQIDGARYHRVAIDTYPLIISSIDGRSTTSRPALVEPGTRSIVVQALPTVAQRVGRERTYVLDVAPCTHYWLVAVKENSLSADYTVKIDYQEPVAGCTAPKG